MRPFSLNKDRIAIMQKKPMIVPSVFANKSSTSQIPRLMASCTSSMTREAPNPIGMVTYHFLHFFQSNGSRAPSGANKATFKRTFAQFFTEKLFQASSHALNRWRLYSLRKLPAFLSIVAEITINKYPTSIKDRMIFLQGNFFSPLCFFLKIKYDIAITAAARMPANNNRIKMLFSSYKTYRIKSLIGCSLSYL